MSWMSLDSSPPAPTTVAMAASPPVGIAGRSSHSISVINDTLYALGGEHLARTPISSNFFTKPLSAGPAGAWTELAVEGSAPSERIAHAQAVVGGRIFIFGGRQGITVGEQALNDLWSFDSDAKKWTQHEHGDGPAPRSFHKMCAIGSDLFVFGGCGVVGRNADLWKFDTVAGKWTVLAGEPPAGLPGRGGAGFLPSSDGKSLFVVGGFIGEESNAVFRFDLAENTWHEVLAEKNDVVRPFSVSCGAMIGGDLCFIGGEVDPSAKGHEGAGGFCNTVVLLDGLTGMPKDAPAGVNEGEGRPADRGWADAAVWPGQGVVIYGGLSGSDADPLRLADTWLYKFD